MRIIFDQKSSPAINPLPSSSIDSLRRVCDDKNTMNNSFCPFCGSPLSLDYIYCPHCGKQVRDAALSFSKQMSVYLFSIFLPPLGLYPGIKYLLSKDVKVKRVGIVVVVLTILSTALTFWLVSATVSQVNTSINSQLQQLQNVGY